MIKLKYFHLRDPSKVLFYDYPFCRMFDHAIELQNEGPRDNRAERYKQMDAWCRMAIGPRGCRSTRHWNRSGPMVIFRRQSDAFAFKVRWSGV